MVGIKLILAGLCLVIDATKPVPFTVLTALKLNATASYRNQTVEERINESRTFGSRYIESDSKGTLLKVGMPRSMAFNGLAEAIHLAYDRHHGLTLRPDHVFIAVLQGLAIHVNMDPEKHKQVLGLSRLAKGQKGKIEVYGNFTLGNRNSDWQGVFPVFQAKIHTKLRRGVSQLISQRFTTSSRLSQAVAAMTVMDTFKAYFEFSISIMFGIPEIALLGTPQDWALLRTSSKQLLSKFDDLQF
ncbi:hypothetical protein DSO57_1025463 [Entomophthora muscae]|uniref:Uncharacterized protein n=1 Tax=Entomophthora muscae TaxID=34485 RepID=A0ACC2UNN1_9FUNG|nr:hypothetical protein DSO57_1025463 [Entomophthora muscae]